MSIISWVLFYANMYNIDPALVMSVIQVESAFNVNAVGTKGEIGLMQLRPEYFPVSELDLFNPKVNIMLGVKSLSEAKKYCKHRNRYEFLVCFNLGVSGGNKIRNAGAQSYYKKVMSEYRKLH